MMIQVKGSIMVRPALPTPRRLLWTSNLDLVVRRSHVLLVYFFRTDGSPNSRQVAQGDSVHGPGPLLPHGRQVPTGPDPPPGHPLRRPGCALRRGGSRVHLPGRPR
uniref:Hydroxycinnamoyl-Coenzyme A shikimate/quinate hydroxycinnamoyltransferase n=1 Tax=Anthurium amnicola TaxID=1678845 RepID=A0A1D1YVL8_9ARAE